MNIEIPEDKIGCIELLMKCECGDPHVASFAYFNDEDIMTLCVTLRSTRQWYKRWWSAIKYALGIHDRWMYDEIVLSHDDVRSIISFLKGFLNK